MSETRKVTRTVTEYKTLNSTYQVDEQAKQFRRVEGVNPALVGPDGEWVDYVHAVEVPVGPDGQVILWIDRLGGRYLRTSLVQSTELVALTE